MRHSDSIFWVEGDPSPGVALVLRPGGTGSLAREMREMQQAGIDVLVSLQEVEEAADFGLAEEGSFAAKAGIQFYSFPIPDHHVPPDVSHFRKFVQSLEALLHEGKRIGIHCQGSIGRATVTAACLLVESGWEPRAALNAIEAARGCEVPDTPDQQEFILRYRARS